MIFTPAQNTSNLLLHCSKNIGKIAISILRLQQKISQLFCRSKTKPKTKPQIAPISLIF